MAHEQFYFQNVLKSIRDHKAMFVFKEMNIDLKITEIVRMMSITYKAQ